MSRLPPALQPVWPLAKALHTRGTGLLAPGSRRLSALLGRGLPTGVATTVEQATRSGGSFVVVRAPETPARTLPPGDAHWRFRAEQRVQVPRVALVELPRGRVIGPHGAVVTADGDLLWEVSRYFGTDRPTRHPVHLHPLTPPPVDLPGRTAVLTTRGDGNYYHFLIDVLPRLQVLADAGVAPVARYLVPTTSSFQRELLQALGLAPDRIIDSTTHRHVRAERLVVPGLPSTDLQTAAWVVAFLRERLLPHDAGMVPGRRLYITRGLRPRTRRVENEADVRRLLMRLGFTVLDPGRVTVAEQVRAFAEAEVIVAPHGAALANLAFASPGCRVVELLARDYVNPCFWVLSCQVPGLDYRYLLGVDRPPARRERAQQGIVTDVRVDLGALGAAVEP